MKLLDVLPFLYGLRQNIAMLNRLGNEMESIHRSVEGLVTLEDSLKGEGGNAIRAFYADCHLPFLQFFTTFQTIFSNVLKRMEGALDALESDPSGIIHERFLEGEIEHGLRNIVQLTESLTSEANSFMSQVADIVALPHLDDSEVQYGVRNAKIKRDDTITKLHEFDATQTTALMPIEHDLMTMESWIADIEGLFTDGLTDIHFPASHWTAISSKNKLKTDLALRSTAKAGLPVMTGVDGQPTTTLGTLLAGGNTIRFGYGIINGTGSLYGPSILSLPGMSTQASPIDRLSEKSTSEDEQLKVLFAALAKQPPVGNQKNYYPIDPDTGDYAFTFEGVRKVVGGNGSGTPDGFAPYAVAAFDFYTEDIGTMLSVDATANQRLEAAAFTFIKPAKGLGMVHDASKAKDVGKVIDIDKPLLPGEGKVGTYEELIDAGTRGDNITPHHMPSAKYMQINAGVNKNDGVSMNMEHPHPGKGGRHRQTETYGMTGKRLEDYLNLQIRDALARDIMDARNIYKKEGLYTPEIRLGLLEVIKLNKKKYPDMIER